MNWNMDKQCKICNDRAFCFNFGVVTCESCKSFFRRNGHLTADDFRCPFDEHCDINFRNRKTCKRCRLEKCLKLGMRIAKDKVYIYKGKTARSEEDSIEFVCIDDDETDRTSDPQSPTSTAFINSFLTPIPVESRYSVESAPTSLNKLKIGERDLIHELWVASSVFLVTQEYIKDLDLKGMLPNEQRPLDKRMAVNLMENCHTKLIEMCKLIQFFTGLNENDQIALLKGSLAEMFFIMELASYNRTTMLFELWPFQPEIAKHFTLANLQELTPASYELAMRYLATFDPQWQVDRTLILLMMAICLFTPRIFNHQFDELDRINEQRRRYELALRSYFQLQCPCPIQANVKAEALLAKIRELQQLQEMPAQKTIKLAQDMLLPLLSELFSNSSDSTAELIDTYIVQEAACA